MKKLVATILILVSAIGIATAAERRFWVFATGQATESDKQSADSEAYNAATEQANSTCIGTVETYERTGGFCLKTGDSDDPQYACSVMLKAMCVLRSH